MFEILRAIRLKTTTTLSQTASLKKIFEIAAHLEFQSQEGKKNIQAFQ